MRSVKVSSSRAIAAVISSGWLSHSRVEPSTSAKSNVTVPVGSPLTASPLHSVALMLTSMRPARTRNHQRMRVYLRPPAAEIRPSTDLVLPAKLDSRIHDYRHRATDDRLRTRPKPRRGTRADSPGPTARPDRDGPPRTRSPHLRPGPHRFA